MTLKKAGGFLAAATVLLLSLAVQAQEAPKSAPNTEPPRKTEIQKEVQKSDGQEAASAAYAPRGSKTCTRCHDQPPVTLIFNTPHAVKGDQRTPFAGHECESCHGASPEHYQGGAPAPGQKRPSPSVVFKGPQASPVEARNGVCMTCHENGLRMNWQGSQHATNDVACTNCHTVHQTKDPVLVKQSQPEKCFTCHAQQRAESFEFSHHPIREGKVVCSDCHNPHGSPGPKLLKELTLNETCYTCHAEKRGPLLWEHEPVREDCSNCHTPHGSTQTRLLKERAPYLCQSCHGAGGHNGAPFAGQNLPGANNNTTATGALMASQFQMMSRGCLNCHSQVHGSNSPGGTYLTR